MILRFINELESHALAFDTVNQVYTTDKDFVLGGDTIYVSTSAIKHMLGELNFNCWDYSKDLSPIEKNFDDIPF